ncbi:MAG: hypothetical protein KF871_10980 [Hydrogenophaga sp.]|uniref:hypothetical protein n=1 Tax=Hydrogenophaga sp. TaxID=1904254 RepID=UPI001D388490|nr:hypothetical protein [Hydrogenophaga sp.]MBX3610406.1 hypothetical protein [Hydrogenophaga sp.]
MDQINLSDLLPAVMPFVREGIALLGHIPWGVRAVFLLWLLWVFYLAVMNLKRVRDAGKLGKVAMALGMPALIVGFVLDVAANLLVFSVLLMEPPRWGEWTVTARLQRHHGDSTWRARVAQWFETELLGDFDPAGHHVAKG